MMEELKRIANKYNCRCFPYRIEYPQYVNVFQVIPRDDTYKYDSLLLYIRDDDTFQFQVSHRHRYQDLSKPYPTTLEAFNLVISGFFKENKPSKAKIVFNKTKKLMRKRNGRKKIVRR